MSEQEADDRSDFVKLAEEVIEEQRPILDRLADD